jgi:ElaB/YqjD/DUF883 family membrane-anchored ribosome-binding protein
MEDAMSRKPTVTKTLDTKGEKIGEPMAKEIVEPSKDSSGIPAQTGFNAHSEIGKLRTELDAMQEQLAAVAESVKAEARQVARQTEATVKLYPVSSLIAVAAVAGVFALAVAGRRVTPARSRYETTMDDIRDLYDKLRDRMY